MLFPKSVSNTLYCFCFLCKNRVKQLTFFERTVLTVSDFKNCTMVHCDIRLMGFIDDDPVFRDTDLHQ